MLTTPSIEQLEQSLRGHMIQLDSPTMTKRDQSITP